MADKHVTIGRFNKPGGSAMHSSIITNDLHNRYRTAKIASGISMATFVDGKNFVFKFKIPSERNAILTRKIFYDVVLEFYPIGKDSEKETKFINYGFRTFSNNPSFTFTLTYVYNKLNSLVLTDYIKKAMYSKKGLSDKPKQSNPLQIVGTEKSIWFALRYLLEITRHNKSDVLRLAHVFPKGTKFPGKVFSDIVSQDIKLEEVRLAEERRKPKKKKLTYTKIKKGTVAPRVGANKQRRASTGLKTTLRDSKLGNKLQPKLASSLIGGFKSPTKSTGLKSGLKK